MADTAPWDEVLAHLRSLDPKVQMIPCRDDGSATETVHFVPLERVSFITSESRRKGFETRLVTDEGRPYFLNVPLGDLAKALAENPRFLRTGKSYLVNLAKIRTSRAGRWRDLQFQGSDEWIENAVSPNSDEAGGPQYAQWFQDRFLGSV